MLTLLGPRDATGRPAWKIVPETTGAYGFFWSVWRWSGGRDQWYMLAGSTPVLAEALTIARDSRSFSPFDVWRAA